MATRKLNSFYGHNALLSRGVCENVNIHEIISATRDGHAALSLYLDLIPSNCDCHGDPPLRLSTEMSHILAAKLELFLTSLPCHGLNNLRLPLGRP